MNINYDNFRWHPILGEIQSLIYKEDIAKLQYKLNDVAEFLSKVW